MDIEVMQRKLNDLTKFRDDMLVLVTREGTMDAFTAMVAERRAQAEHEKAEQAAEKQAELDAPKEPDSDPAFGDQKPNDGAKGAIAGAEKGVESGKDDGAGKDPANPGNAPGGVSEPAS